MRSLVVVPILLCVASMLASPGPASAQCILANPSFEVGGTGETPFGGWNGFGRIATADVALHGAVGARVTGPDLGAWEVSALWQAHDAHEGERFEVSVHAWQSMDRPLTGASRAILNVEWRDATGALLDYESHTVLEAGMPREAWVEARETSAPAPVGTVEARILFGVLQAPDEPAPEVVFDQAVLESLDTPTLEEQQWLDFPGGRTLEFSGFTWRIKGPGWYDPGPGWYCDDPGCVWVDAQGRLHLTAAPLSGSTRSSEITLTEALGYGDYVFTTVGPVDQLDPNVVLGLFLWQYGPCWDPSFGWWNPYDEIDVEISRWGDPARDPVQFVTQPFDWPGNIERFDMTLGPDERSSHAFRWLPDRVEFRSWRGGPDDEPEDPDSPDLLHAWTYTGPHVPRPERPRVHLNLWGLPGGPQSAQEVVVESFRFDLACHAPLCDPTTVDVPEAPPARAVALRLENARPNPFNPRTAIEFELARAGAVSLVVHDVAGRRVRTLIEGRRVSGVHTVVWDGRDDAGRTVASGVYLVRLRQADAERSRRVVLIR